MQTVVAILILNIVSIIITVTDSTLLPTVVNIPRDLSKIAKNTKIIIISQLRNHPKVDHTAIGFCLGLLLLLLVSRISSKAGSKHNDKTFI